MTTTVTPTSAGEQTEAVLHVFRESNAPLSVARARALYKGPNLNAQGWTRILEELVLEGKLFECFPAGRNKRYWVHDEKERIRNEIERVLSNRPLGLRPLTDEVVKSLRGISAKNSVERCVQEMQQEGLLHNHPGRQRNLVLLSLQPFDPQAAIQFKAATLNDLSSVLQRLEPFGLGFDQFLEVLKGKLQARLEGATRQPKGPRKPTSPKPKEETKPNEEKKKDPALAAPAPKSPSVPSREELETLILKGMHDLEPNVDNGAPVLLCDLRRHMPKECRGHDVFDPVVIGLAEKERVVLLRHDQPSFLSEVERDELVRDEAGTYYTVIAQRV